MTTPTPGPPGFPASASTTVRVPGVDGLELVVHHVGGPGPGAGQGSDVVLAHATGFHGRVWQPLAEHLGPTARCVAPDLRAHGDSSLPPGLDLDWHGFADDLLAVVDGLGLAHPVGVGHSSGATALLLAEQARPGRFRALYCYEPVLVPVDPPLGPDPDSWLGEQARARRATFDSRREALDHYAHRRGLSDLDPAALEAYVDHGLADAPDGTVRLKCRPAHEARVYELATAHDAFVHLGRVCCQVTLARGGRSDAFGRRHADAVAARLTAARHEEHAGLGHLGPLQDPRAVADSIRAVVEATS